MRVRALFIHPVKGCRALAVAAAQLGPLGLDGDRRFAFAAEDGTALTQRDQPLLATIAPALHDDNLFLDLGGIAQLTLAVSKFSESTRVDVWGYAVAGRATRDDSLDDYLGARVRLVMLDPGSPRAFVDSRPVLVVTPGMLSELNLPGLPMDRFRPNVILEGTELGSVLEGKEIRLEREKPCGRCEVTTIDQSSGERRGPEPLQTLSERFGGNFGIYYRVARAGRLRRGEDLQAS